MSNETQRAIDVLERNMGEAADIGKAKSRHEAVTAFRSMCGAVRQIRREYKNVLTAVDDTSAGYALEILPLLETAEKWQVMALEAMLEWGVTRKQAEDIEREIGG